MNTLATERTYCNDFKPRGTFSNELTDSELFSTQPSIAQRQWTESDEIRQSGASIVSLKERCLGIRGNSPRGKVSISQIRRKVTGKLPESGRNADKVRAFSTDHQRLEREKC